MVLVSGVAVELISSVAVITTTDTNATELARSAYRTGTISASMAFEIEAETISGEGSICRQVI